MSAGAVGLVSCETEPMSGRAAAARISSMASGMQSWPTIGDMVSTLQLSTASIAPRALVSVAAAMRMCLSFAWRWRKSEMTFGCVAHAAAVDANKGVTGRSGTRPTNGPRRRRRRGSGRAAGLGQIEAKHPVHLALPS